ncbi:sugar-binding domain-containing protein [Rhizobium ruizarguesonis]
MDRRWLALPAIVTGFLFQHSVQVCRAPSEGPGPSIDCRRRGYRKDKVPAIRAALRGGYVNILVTDKITAEMLLDEA